MNTCDFEFCGAELRALPSGALYWPSEHLLVVSDLHLGKSARLSAVGGAQLPPYDCRETLGRLDADIATMSPKHVVCLGDSFDTINVAAELPEDEKTWIARMQAGRTWTWIEGNHDPGPVELGGTHRADLHLGGLVFRHMAAPDAQNEVSGHFHPKARLFPRGRAISRACFLFDSHRMILPAYGAYTGGLHSNSAVLRNLLSSDAMAILTGPRPALIPMPRAG